MSKISRDHVLGFISEAMKENPQEEQDSDGSIIRAVILRDPSNLAGRAVENYVLDLESIEILDSTFKEEPDTSDYTDDQGYAIITFDKGMALVSYSHSADYTFSNTEYLLDIVETNDWDVFDRVCLTDELRELFRDFVAEMKLLRE